MSRSAPLNGGIAKKKAVRLLKKVVALNPGTYYPYAILGTAFMKMGHTGRALSAFEKAAAIEANPVNLNNLGAALYMAGRAADAAPHFSRACSVELPEDDALGAQISLGFCLALTGHEEEALQTADGLAGRAGLWLPDVAGIFYAAGANEQAVTVFSECLAGPFSKTLDWIEPDMCALAKCGRLAEAGAIRDQVLKESSDWIADLKEELRKKEPNTTNDFSTFKRRGIPATIRAEKEKMSQIRKASKRAATGHHAVYTFHPALLQECWFFGCLRHGNPDYVV